MSVPIAVVDYEAGNLRSVETALRHLGAAFVVTSSPDAVRGADRVIVPGVGDARAAMQTLRSRGLDQAIIEQARRGTPIFGICLGSQIVLERSEENDAMCLGLIPGTARLFSPQLGLKVPHMGWNRVEWSGDHPLFAGLRTGVSVYFVHSYYPAPASADVVLGWCEYGVRFAAVVARDNVLATQFHPEKSGAVGLRMLENFLRMRG